MNTPPFGPNAILISPSSMAHRPGCGHNDDGLIRSGEHREWGWVPEATSDQWLRIGESLPLRATHGDLSRSAVKRCKDCPDS